MSTWRSVVAIIPIYLFGAESTQINHINTDSFTDASVHLFMCFCKTNPISSDFLSIFFSTFEVNLYRHSRQVPNSCWSIAVKLYNVIDMCELFRQRTLSVVSIDIQYSLLLIKPVEWLVKKNSGICQPLKNQWCVTVQISPALFTSNTLRQVKVLLQQHRWYHWIRVANFCFVFPPINTT